MALTRRVFVTRVHVDTYRRKAGIGNGFVDAYNHHVGTRLETSRLIVRSYEPRDAAAWVALVSDPEVRRFLPPGPVPTLGDFPGALERRRAREASSGFAMWAVDLKEDQGFVGQCGLNLIEGTDSEVELAYHFDRASWGNGYATEAGRAVLAHGFDQVALDRVIAVVVPENVASWRVLEKIGMRYEGLATYYEMDGLKKYVAEPGWWTAGHVKV